MQLKLEGRQRDDAYLSSSLCVSVYLLKASRLKGEMSSVAAPILPFELLKRIDACYTRFFAFVDGFKRRCRKSKE